MKVDMPLNPETKPKKYNHERTVDVIPEHLA